MRLRTSLRARIPRALRPLFREKSGCSCVRGVSGRTFSEVGVIRAVQILVVAISAAALCVGACSQPGPPVSGDIARDAGEPKSVTLISDAGLYGSARTPNGVSCPSVNQVCASPANVCCGVAKFQAEPARCPPADSGLCVVQSDFIGYDTSCASDPATCAGELNQACDGPEDCQAAQSCCITEVDSWYFKTACAPSCHVIGSEAPGVLAQLCHDHRDCPPDYAACCGAQATDASQVAAHFCWALSALKPDVPLACDVP